MAAPNPPASTRAPVDASTGKVSNEMIRKIMEESTAAAVKALGPISDKLEEFWTDILLQDGYKSKSLVIRPKTAVSSNSDKKHPLIVLFFGGGFAGGGPEQLTRPARNYAEKFDAVVVCPSYRLVPDVKWPVPMKDGYDAVAYLAKNAETDFGATLDGPGGAFVIGGASSGASIAAVAGGIHIFGDDQKKNVEELAKPITGLCLSLPLLLTEKIVPDGYKSSWTSRVDSNNQAGFTGVVVDQLVAGLQPDVRSPWFSPFNAVKIGDKAPTQSHPPVYLQACQLDPLRDDAIIYKKMLASMGVKTKIDVFPEDGHTPWTVLDVQFKSQGPTIPEATMSGMEWLLQG